MLCVVCVVCCVQQALGFVASFQNVRIPTNRNSAVNQCIDAAGMVTVLTGDRGTVAGECVLCVWCVMCVVCVLCV